MNVVVLPKRKVCYTVPIMKTTPWWALTPETAVERFTTDRDNGLAIDEAAKRLAAEGRNEFSKAERPGLQTIFVRQFKSPLVFVLLLAGIATLLLREYFDAIVIFISLAINVVVGIVQEGRASRAFERLAESQEQYATVVRNGERRRIVAAEIVTGDIVVLVAGGAVPADLRLTDASELSINEAVLSGEWAAVDKDVVPTTNDAPLSERRSMAWMGTHVSDGQGRGIVVATGDATEIGRLAKSLQGIERGATPIQKSIQGLAVFLARVISVVLLIIFVAGLLRGEALAEMVLLSIAIAVAVMPVGLPAAVTVALAVGMETILKRGGLVRSLLAAETLGSTTVIATDKTGTLTEGRMSLAQIVSADLQGERTHSSQERGTADGSVVDDSYWLSRDVPALLSMAVLASDAFVEEATDATEKLTVHGRPIEAAIIMRALEAGLSPDKLLAERKRLDFLPFASSRRFGASLHGASVAGDEIDVAEDTQRLFVSGAPELLLGHAEYAFAHGEAVPLTPDLRRALEHRLKAESGAGLRVIAVGYRDVVWETIGHIKGMAHSSVLLEGLVFGGFLIFNDPLRQEVVEAIRTAKESHIHVAMLTGDNPETAFAIAVAAGIIAPHEQMAHSGTASEEKEPRGHDRRQVLVGSEIEAMSDVELWEALRTTTVIARVLPEQKLRIVELLKRNGEVVAMTGDGVNDAPALVAADIGIAVGSGTDVAKEASDIVLLKNSFATIVSAIEEGRRIVDNLKKSVTYLLSTGFSELFVVAGALAVGGPLPLLPIQILWTNFIEAGLMTFAFAFEPKESNLMRRPPASRQGSMIMTPAVKRLIVVIGMTTGMLLVGLYLFLVRFDLPQEKLHTIMFVALSIDSIFFSFSLKNLHEPLWRIHFFSNRYLLAALGTSLALLVAAIMIPPVRTLLSLSPLTPVELLFLFGVGIINVATIEVGKWLLFRRRVL